MLSIKSNFHQFPQTFFNLKLLQMLINFMENTKNTFTRETSETVVKLNLIVVSFSFKRQLTCENKYQHRKIAIFFFANSEFFSFSFRTIFLEFGYGFSSFTYNVENLKHYNLFNLFNEAIKVL